MRDPESHVSAHYVIDWDEVVYQLVLERVVAYHVSRGVEESVRSCSAFLCGDGKPDTRMIGIELINLGIVLPNWQGIIYEDYRMALAGAGVAGDTPR